MSLGEEPDLLLDIEGETDGPDIQSLFHEDCGMYSCDSYSNKGVFTTIFIVNSKYYLD